MASLQEVIWENVSSQPLKTSLANKYYKLSEWPDFGFSKYSPEFIVISANLTRQYMSKTELLKLVDSKESIVNHFLNASSLLQILESQNSRDGIQLAESNTAVSRFTSKLKRFFYH